MARFAPMKAGQITHHPRWLERDFTAIKSAGLNSLRLYTVPPSWLLDLAAAQGLRVMIGLPWEQHIAFLDDKARVEDIIARIRGYVRQCAGHPSRSLLCRWQRDSGLCRALVWQAPHSKIFWLGFVGL